MFVIPPTQLLKASLSTNMTIPYPIIHINGFPGTGKLTIATALTALLPTTTKLVHNHLLINPADAILTRSQSGYQNLRRAIRNAVFQSLIHEPATYETAYIFTDFQSTDAVGSGVCKEFEVAADERGGAFVPILLKCEERVNLERLVSEDRAKHRKLTDVELVRTFRENVEIYRFEKVENALELDATGMTAEEAARRVLKHLVAVCPDLTGAA
jgi:broad-specificity NMP kinase